MTSVFDTRFGPSVYWLRPLVHGEVAVRLLETAYIPQTRQLLTALDLARIALGSGRIIRARWVWTWKLIFVKISLTLLRTPVITQRPYTQLTGRGRQRHE